MKEEHISQLMETLTDLGVSAQKAREAVARARARAHDLSFEDIDDMLKELGAECEVVAATVEDEMRALAETISLPPGDADIAPAPLRYVKRTLMSDI